LGPFDASELGVLRGEESSDFTEEFEARHVSLGPGRHDDISLLGEQVCLLHELRIAASDHFKPPTRVQRT
jgi:hypothetical protein